MMNMKKNGKILLILMGIYLMAGLVYTIVIYVCVQKNHTPQMALEQIVENEGLEILDDEGNVYDTLRLKTDRWLSYQEIPESFRNIAPVRGTIGDTLSVYFELQTGKFQTKTYTDLLVSDAEKHGILATVLGKTGIPQKQILSEELGNTYTTEEIVETWFNTMDFGNGIYGLSAAARAYETEDFQNLSEESLNDLYQIAVNIIKEGIYPEYASVNQQTAYYSEDAFCDGLVKQLIEDLQKQGCSRDDAAAKLFFKGYCVTTSLNQELQQLVNDKYASRDTFTTLEEGHYIQSAMVIMDTQGNVKAAAGGNDGNTLFNRALSVNRQIGSTIKPFAIYAPAMERGIINYSSLIEDAPIQISRNGELADWPENYDGSYDGSVTVTKALQVSKNTVAVRIGQMLGEWEIYDFLKDKLLFSNLDTEQDVQLSALALGYLSEGITLDKLVSCYEPFSGTGVYTLPSLYQELTDNNGKIVRKNEPESVQAVSQVTASIMNRLLLANVEEEGALAADAAIEGVEVIGKTGTVGVDESVKYQYFVGMTSEYIAGVWIGFDGEETLNLKNYKHATAIWKTVMEEISRDAADFTLSDEIEEKLYCSKTGLIVTEDCGDAAVGWYAKSGE